MVNTFLNTTDPNTLLYDNIVSNFHATFVRELDGTIIGWGENIGAEGARDILDPTAIVPDNGYTYQGKPLKFAAGSKGINTGQYALLTTDGLYTWGKVGNLVSSEISNTSNFKKISIGGKKDGLPSKVVPKDVKMLFGSYSTLAIVTDKGQAWVLSEVGSKSGDGSMVNKGKMWTRVLINKNTPLTQVVAVRGTPFALAALTAEGKIYTWGINTYLGDGTHAKNRYYATEMLLPYRVVPKMIGMTTNALMPTYYLLTKKGNLYSLGYNSKRQLGTWNTLEQTFWVQPTKPTLSGHNSNIPFTNVAWISPDEHDGSGFPAINIITQEGKLYAWGLNHRGMIGCPLENKTYNPTFMPGKLDSSDIIEAVETGGHTSIIFEQCAHGYGYVGHKINGSMGDGSATEKTGTKYHFIKNHNISPYGVPQIPKIVVDTTDNICTGFKIKVNDPGGAFHVLSNNAKVSSSGELTITGLGTLKIEYQIPCGKDTVFLKTGTE